jgi:hypothetical protein
MCLFIFISQSRLSDFPIHCNQNSEGLLNNTQHMIIMWQNVSDSVSEWENYVRHLPEDYRTGLIVFQETFRRSEGVKVHCSDHHRTDLPGSLHIFRNICSGSYSWLTAYSRILEKEIIMQLDEGSVLCSQESASGCCPEPVESTSSYHISLKYIVISHLCLGLRCGHFLSGCPSKIWMKFCLVHVCCMCYLSSLNLALQ